MYEYTKVDTTRDVWLSVKEQHNAALVVFKSVSYPRGDHHNAYKEGRRMTEYGFNKAACPFIGVETRWDINPENFSIRDNERDKYWFCSPVSSERR